MRLNSKVGEWLLLIAPVSLVFCSFANTLGYGFVYDDRFQIVEAAPYLQDWHKENLARIFDRDIWGFFCQGMSWEGKTRTPYYRPVFALFVMLNYLYAGLNPFWWHLTAILLHAFATALAYRLLLSSLKRASAVDESEAPWLAMIGAAFFAVHPAQSESVAWLAAYVNALSAIFMLGAMLAYLGGEKLPGLEALKK